MTQDAGVSVVVGIDPGLDCWWGLAAALKMLSSAATIETTGLGSGAGRAVCAWVALAEPVATPAFCVETAEVVGGVEMGSRGLVVTEVGVGVGVVRVTSGAPIELEMLADVDCDPALVDAEVVVEGGVGGIPVIGVLGVDFCDAGGDEVPVVEGSALPLEASAAVVDGAAAVDVAAVDVEGASVDVVGPDAAVGVVGSPVS